MTEIAQGSSREHLLIVSQDLVNSKMAGPGIRYLEMAKCLSHELDVTLAVPAETSLKFPEINILRYFEDRPESLQLLVENADIVLISGYMILKFPFLANCKQRLVVDLYDPIVFENLHYFQDEPQINQDNQNKQAVNVTNSLAKIGDFFICGNERQRDLWMGVLMANGRINPKTFTQDNSLSSLIDIVGAGFPDRPPRAVPFLRKMVPEIPENARVILWGGGIWNWLDPLTLVNAWPDVLAVHPEARLVFLGTRHPNPVVPDHEMAFKTVQLAEQLGEKDKSIIFFEWISYEDREALLCESDVGVTLHPIHVETRYSIRTRVLDYLWAKLPVLITDGDVTSQWVREFNIGIVVPPDDSKAVSKALLELLDRPKSTWEPNFATLPDRMSWSHAVKPLLNYCLYGRHAPDRVPGENPIALPVAMPSARPVGLGQGILRAAYILRSKGLVAAWHQIIFHLKWLISHKR
jgi:glycosyltransferase involved in cell wall biosynthesis